MRRLFVLAIAVALALVVALPAGAGNGRNFTAAPLSGSNEVPANDSQGSGVAHFKLSKDGTALSYKLIVANLDNVLQAHIHCGSADENGAVVAFLYPPAPPAQLIPGTFNGVLQTGVITDAQIIPLVGNTICGADIEDLDDLIAQMRAGNTYVNVHTTALPGGEIRGQIK